METTQVHKRPLPSYVAKHFQAHKASGKTIKDYCKEVGISTQTFYTWRKKYRNHKKRTANRSCFKSTTHKFSTLGAISFQDIHQPLFDIHIAGGPRVSIYSGTTAQVLAPFIEVLAGGNAPC